MDTAQAMTRTDAWLTVQWRAAAAGIAGRISCHTFRATGIPAYLKSGGALEHLQHSWGVTTSVKLPKR